MELILVDDGSTDNTLNICMAYAENDSRVKVIHKENGGHTSARNVGLKEAIGEYILFLDSDDWISSKTVESCFNEIVVHYPDILIYKMKNVDNAKTYPVLLSDGYYKIETLEKSAKNDFIISAEGKFVFPKSLSAKCFKYDAIYKHQMAVPKEILLGEDGAAFIDALLNSTSISVIINKDACYYCIVRSDSVSRRSDLAAFDKASILLLYYVNMLKNKKIDYLSQFNRYVVAQLYTATLLVIRGGGGKKELNAGLGKALGYSVISNALKKAKFNLKGYKFIIKKIIIRHRLWKLVKLIDG